MKDIKFNSLKELEEKVKKQDVKIIKQIKIAKEKVIKSWDEGRDGRKFKEFSVPLEEGYSMEILVLENNKGLVIQWGGLIIGIDNWGKIVHQFNVEDTKEKFGEKG